MEPDSYCSSCRDEQDSRSATEGRPSRRMRGILERGPRCVDCLYLPIEAVHAAFRVGCSRVSKLGVGAMSSSSS